MRKWLKSFARWLWEFLKEYVPWTAADRFLDTKWGNRLLVFLGGAVVSGIGAGISYVEALAPAWKYGFLGALVMAILGMIVSVVFSRQSSRGRAAPSNSMLSKPESKRPISEAPSATTQPPKLEVAESAVSTATTCARSFIAVPLPSFVATLGAIGIGAAIGIGGWWLLSTLQPISSRQSPLSVQNLPLINVSPDYLIRILRNHTDYQGQKLLQQYMGKWMRVEGQVDQVGAPSGAASGAAIVILDGDNSARPPFYIGLVFNKDWFDRASSLAKGDRILVIGKIYEIDADTIRLSDCEFQFDRK